MKGFNLCLVWIILASVRACDLDTQYEKDGACCKMCGPGTRMASQTSCEDPLCRPCGKHEYQSGYTRDTKCQLQPVCDKNMNLEQKELDPKVRVSCTCKAEHHCSSEECLTCVPDRVCGPGEGVIKMATQHNDTICQVCPPGTFSNEISSVQRCRPWMTCDEKMPKIKKAGTPTSDVECEANSIALAVGISIFVAALLLLLTALVLFFIKKDPKMLKSCFRKDPDNEYGRNEAALLQPSFTKPQNEVGNGLEGESQGPEENDDVPPVQEKAVSDNENPVRQEVGKRELISQEESDGSAERYIESL